MNLFLLNVIRSLQFAPRCIGEKNMNICAQSVGVASDKRAQRHAYLQRESVHGNSIRGVNLPASRGREGEWGGRRDKY